VQDLPSANRWLAEARLREQDLEDQRLRTDRALDEDQVLMLMLLQSMTAQALGRPEQARRLFDSAASGIQARDQAALGDALRELVNEAAEALPN